MALDFSNVTIGSEEEDQKKNLVETNYSEALKLDADKYAKDKQLSTETGVPVEAVDETTQHQLDFEKFDANKLKKSPATTKHLLDFDNVVVAQDDIDTMTKIEEGLTVTSDVARSFPAGAVEGYGMATQGYGRWLKLLGRQTVPDNSMASQLFAIAGQWVKGEGAEAKETAAVIGPPAERKNIATDISGALGQMGFQIAASIVNPGIGGAALFSQGVDIQGEKQEQTGTEGQDIVSDLALAGGGVITAVTEKIGLDKLLNRVPPKIKNKVVRTLADVGIAGGIESVQEVVEGISQNLLELYTTNPDAEIFQGIENEAIVAGSAGAIMRSIILAAAPGKVRTVQDDQTATELKSESEQKSIDALNENTTNSKLKERDAESFRQFVAEADGENDTHVFIDGAQVSLYLQDKTPEEIQSDPALKLLAEQAAESTIQGNDVQIPVADFATDVIGTEHYDALRDNMTMSAESVAPFRQEQVKQETETYIKNLMEEADVNSSQYIEAQEIFNTIKDQLVDSGQVAPANATFMAQVVPAWATAQAKRQGKPVQQIFEESGLNIQGPQTGEAARLDAEVLAQYEVKEKVTGADFNKSISEAAAKNPNAPSLDIYTPEEYDNSDLYTFDDGKAGFAISPDGVLLSVFKHPDSEIKGAMNVMMPEAIRRGATSLEAFEGFLTESYAKFGFEEVSRVPWDNKYKPEGWTDEMGTPSVVTMELNNEKFAEYERNQETARAETPEQGQTQGREEDGSLGGLPRNVEGFEPKVSETISDVAAYYMESAGLPYYPISTYKNVDPDFATQVADAYEQMEHAPNDPEVKAAYEQLAKETIAQYQAALDAGLKVEFIEFEKDGDPYEESPRMVTDDINENNHMWVFSTRDGFGSDETFDPTENPLLAETEFEISGQKALVNDLFRVVHDYFGHAKEGVGFRANGEENAFRVHSSMFSPDAQRALATETRGQNSWLNFGPHGEKNRTAKTEDTVFADQKTGLLPVWASAVIDGESLPATLQRQSGDGGVPYTPSEFTPNPDIFTLKQSVTLRKGTETLKRFGLDPNKVHKTRDVAAALEARQRKKFGKIDPKDNSPEASRRIADWMVQEVLFELDNKENSGAGWYSEKFQRALDTFAEEFPELKTDKAARDTFTALIAITSDGQKVKGNFAMAEDIYRNYRETGQFTTAKGTQRQASVTGNLKVLQELTDTMGAEAVHAYLMEEMTVGELKKLARDAGVEFKSDYKVDVVMPRAALVLGPKLGAFYANLMGADGYLTMDRWWSRSFNRYRGTLLQSVKGTEDAPTDSKGRKIGLARFKELIGEPELSDDEAISRTVEYRDSYADKGYKNGTEIEKAANTIHKAAFENIEDAPYNASDRSFMLQAVGKAAKTLKRKGHDISVADIQAILWYYEKRLYGELGTRQTADISYEEAARELVSNRAKGPDTQDRLEQSVRIGEEVFNSESAEEAKVVRGYYDPANSMIRLNEAADLSTFLHEFAHFMYEMELKTNDGMITSINNWYKRNAEDVAKEANDYLGDQFDGLKQAAYHGTPHKFDKFSMSAIGTGEGAQVYGHGLYFAENKEVAEAYRKLADVTFTYDGDISPEALQAISEDLRRGSSDITSMDDMTTEGWKEYLEIVAEDYGNARFTGDGNPDPVAEEILNLDPEKLNIGDGAVYEVDIPDEHVKNFLDWDAPLSQQPESVRNALMDAKVVGSTNKFVDDSGMTGKEIYNLLSRNRGSNSLQIRGGDKATSKYLDSLGIKGIRYKDAGSRGDNIIDRRLIRLYEKYGDLEKAVDELMRSVHESPKVKEKMRQSFIDQFEIPTNNLVVFDENIVTIKTINGEPVFEQTGAPTGKEGSITAADVNAFLDQMTTGDADKDAAIRRAVHEQFARGFETYLMEGKAPSIELRNAFRAFARWLSRIYQMVKGNLNVNLDNEMREVFDRLLATEEQILAAQTRARVEPMFTDAAMAGMTEAEFAAYNKRQEKVKDIQSETLRDKIMKQLTRQTTKWWRTELSDIVDEQTDKLSKEQVYKAREELKNGEFKIDHAAVKEMVGEVKTDKIGRKSKIVPPALKGMTAKGMAGVHPDEAAAFFGYNSGSEMLKDLIEAPSIKDQAEKNAQDQMVETHGDILNDGTIEKEADEAVRNEERGKVILQELKILARGTNAPTVDRQTIKALAAERIGKLSFRQIHPAKYRKAEIRAAQEAATMLAAGNKEGAAGAKLRQVMNYYLGMAATEAKNETTNIVDFMNRYKKKKVRESIMKSENGYWDQIVKILDRFEFRKAATLKDVESINLWMKERMESDGDALVLSNAVLNETYLEHWKNVPYSDLQGIRDSVKNIEHVARYANKIRMQQEEIDFKKLKNKWVESIGEQDARFSTKESRSRIDDARKATAMEHVRKWASQLTKIPFLASWLDGGERAGLSHDILIQPLTDALDAKMKLVDDVATPVLELINNVSKDDRKRHNTKIYIPEIGDHLMGHQVLAVALNTGNQGNLKKMLLGEGWADPENDAEITFDNAQLQAVLSHMNENDWILVQKIWDQMEILYPMLADVHRRTTGLTPPKVQSTEIVNDYGTFRGGYYPVKYSPKRSHKAEKNAEKRDAETESMFNNTASIQSSVNAGATNERTGFYDRIHLSLEVVPDHFNETIHYITHHDAVRQINRLIQSPDVASAITGVLGEEEYKQLKPWLNDVAKDGRQQPIKTYIDTAFQRLRFGTTLGVMGFKASTGIMQLFGIMTTAAELGTGPTLKGIYTSIGRSWYLKAVRNLLGSRDDMQTGWEFATEKSKVMNHRVKTMDREIRNAMDRLRGKSGIVAAVQETSMKHIALIQTYMIDLPTWHAAYQKELAESGDEAKAISRADWSVENLQGSGATKDMATLMRNQAKIHTTFTMFMTFFSSLGNLSRDLVKGGKSGIYSPTSVAAKTMFLFTLPVFFEMLMRGEFEEPDDEDDRLSKFATQVALYPTTSIPFVRDVAGGLIGDFGYNSSPVAAMLERGIQGSKQIGERAFTDDEITKAAIKNTSKLAAAAAGIPGVNQAWATGEHLYDVIENGEELTLRELTFGPDRE